MNLNEAIIKRIKELCKENKMSVTAFSLESYITPSTLFDILNGKSKKPQVETIKKVCLGAGITLSEFFDREYFNNFDDILK